MKSEEERYEEAKLKLRKSSEAVDRMNQQGTREFSAGVLATLAAIPVFFLVDRRAAIAMSAMGLFGITNGSRKLEGAVEEIKSSTEEYVDATTFKP